MDKDSIYTLLSLLGSKVSQVQARSGWVVASCIYPWNHSNGVDNNPSFGVTISDEESRYHCFSCNASGDLMDIPLRLGVDAKKYGYSYDWELINKIIDGEALGDMVIKDYHEITESDPNNITVYPEWWLDSFYPVEKFKKALDYLKKRHVTPEIITQLNLKYDTVRHRVCFPIRDWNGFLVGLHGRDIRPTPSQPYNAYPYKGSINKVVWMGESWVDLDKPVLAVESLFDLTSVLRVYPNSICSLTAGMSKHKIRRLKDAIEIITLYDYGQGGNAARTAFDKHLHKMSVTHLIPTAKQDDPGNMSVSELESVLDDYLLLTTFT